MGRKAKLFLMFVTAGTLFFNPHLAKAQRQGDPAAKANDGATGTDWPAHGGTNSSWRYSGLSQINTTNVKKLLPAWTFQTGDYLDGLSSTPIVVDGVLFLSAFDDVWALNGATGEIIWQYKYQPIPGSYPGRNLGVAVSDGKVFMSTHDAHVVALDQKTGKEVWKVASDDATACGRCGMQAAPLIVKDKVVVGEAGPRGRLTAFDTKTGRLAWRFYTVPGPGEPGHDTWTGDTWKRGGINVWTTGSFDPELNLVYWGMGDSSSTFSGRNRESKRLYSDSVVALDADTGKLKWYYQEIPNDVWDYDASWELVLMDREVNGKMRKLAVQAAKCGFTFVLDRVTGELLGVYPYSETNNWVKGISQKGELIGRNDTIPGKTVNICPNVGGAKNWNQIAYSPKTGYIYVPVVEMCNDLTLPELSQTGVESGGTWVFTAPPGKPTAYSHIDAYEPVTGKKMWSYPYKYQIFASIMATAGDLMFTGDPEGHFFALDARTGKELWSFQTGAGHRGAAVTYMVNGRQYVATPTGMGHVGFYNSGVWPEVSTWRYGSTLMVFALPEESK